MTGVLLGQTAKGANVELDLQELVTGRTFLCSTSGAGKSHTCRRITEQAFGKAGLIIIDVEGEYASLREKFPFLIIGRDVPLVPEAAEFLADQTLADDLSVIIDGSDINLDDATFQEFVQRFVDRFLAVETTQRKPYLVIAEEADELAPEHNFAKSLCGPAMMKLAKKGRKRGVGLIVVTQRPPSVAKGVIALCRSKAIGQLDWDPDKEVVHKFARIPEDVTARLATFERGEFYISGDFVAKPVVVHVGPIVTKHVGETPEVVPPAPKELADVIAQLAQKLPAITREKLAPEIPHVREIEDRIKVKFEAQWQARLDRVKKERDTAAHRFEAKYETKIADLQRKLDDAVRHATMKGGVSDLLSHPLVQKNLEKLKAKQRAFVELLETKGPQDSEHASLFLEIKPKSVPDFTYDINRKIPKLIENQGGRYISRLAKLFPVTEEAQAEAKESETLRSEVQDVKALAAHKGTLLDQASAEIGRLTKELRSVTMERDMFKRSSQAMAEAADAEHQEKIETSRQLSGVSETRETSVPSGTRGTSETSVPANSRTVIPVEATLRRTLTSLDVIANTEKFDAEESTWEGKILARGVDGFFKEPKRLGTVVTELVRRYDVSDSGGNRESVGKALAMLVSKGILDRQGTPAQWQYSESPEFRDRVRQKEVA
jgi:hypothetical protein